MRFKIVGRGDQEGTKMLGRKGLRGGGQNAKEPENVLNRYFHVTLKWRPNVYSTESFLLQ